mgnify:CR=1 FL=1
MPNWQMSIKSQNNVLTLGVPLITLKSKILEVCYGPYRAKVWRDIGKIC